MNLFIKRSGINDEEFKKLILLILHSFFSAIFVSIFFSVANAEFVNNFGSSFLPVGYLLSGVVGYLTVQGYSRLLKRSGFSAFAGGLFFLLGCTVLFRCVLFFTNPETTRWLSFVIFLFAMPFLAISGLEQSGLLLKIYNIREGKKYAGIINSGGTAASILGYLSIPVLIPYLHSRYDLFFIAILGMGAALYVLYRIAAVHRFDEPAAVNPASPAYNASTSLPVLLRQKYIRYIAICGGISMMAFYFVDYSFLVNAKVQARSPEELSAIIGGFFAFIKMAELLLSLLSGKFFRRFGLKTGIVILPAICLFVSICAVLIHNFSGAAFFIFIIFLLKFFERIVSKAIEEPTYKNLYQLLDAPVRLAIQAKIDGGTKQLFIVLGSLVLLIYGHFVPAEKLNTVLLYISIPLFLFWLFCAIQLVRSFKEKLRDILNSGEATHAKVPVFERLRSLLFNEAETGSARTTLVNLLVSKTELPFQQTVLQPAIAKEEPYDTFIPSPELKYLVPAGGHAKLEVQLDQPMLLIPPKQNTDEISASKNFDLDEKEILRIALSQQDPGEAILKALGEKLNDVKQDHEKKMVINILTASKNPVCTSILTDHLNHPDYYIRKQVFKALESRNFKCVSAEDDLLFRNTLDVTLANITYVISALGALPTVEQYADLNAALAEEEHVLKNRILSMLTWKYDRASIHVIRENIFSGNSLQETNTILALELIDNLVETEIKQRIMAVFESGVPASRLATLAKWYYFPQQDVKATLIGILNYDYTGMGTWSKACALSIFIREKEEYVTQIVAGFMYHPNTFLRSLAQEYIASATQARRQKEILTLQANPKNTAGNFTGTAIYDNVKLLKAGYFFRKASCNDLISFASAVELKSSHSLQKLAGNGIPGNKSMLLLKGNVVIEFQKKIPPALFATNCIVPSMFSSGALSELAIRSESERLEFPPQCLANLLLTSDAMLSDLMSSR